MTTIALLCPAADLSEADAPDGKCLSRRQDQVNFKLNGSPHGECRMEWSSKDLIEEELLKNATAEKICGWLKAHANKNFWELDLNFSKLREKYEPIWSADENSALKMSVCLYGRDFKTLRSLFYSELPDHFKEAVLSNPAFASDAGLYSTGQHYCLVEEDILELYKKYKRNRKDRSFISLFENPALPEEFIARIYRKQRPYQDISDKHLLEVFCVMFLSERNNYFYKNKLKYAAHHGFKSDGRMLANEIIRFIPNIKKITKNKKIFCHFPIAFSIEHFLEGSSGLDTNGIPDENTLLTFIDKPDDAQLSFDDEQLIRIQLELGRRAFSGVLRNGNSEKLLELGKSNYARMRSIYYQFCDLGLIYNLPHWQLENFFKNTSTSCLDWVLWGEGEPPEPISDEYRPTLKALGDILKKDGVTFAGALALNEKHYTSKKARLFLQEICRQGDILGKTFPWPLGNGTCVDVFEAKCENLKKERPEFFEDEAPERILRENTEFLKEISFDIRSSVEKSAKGQAALNKINVSQLDAIKKKFDDQQQRLEQIDNRITGLQKSISERIKGPTDFSSVFLYRMPIVGGILRAIFK